MGSKVVPKQTLRRLPIYLSTLKSLCQDGVENISSSVIAGILGLKDVQVRKDLAFVSDGGRPKLGYIAENLISDIEKFLGYDNADKAVLVGAGNLGQALVSYKGFSECGLDIVMAFDNDNNIVGKSISGKAVLPVEKLTDLCRRMQIKIGIITVPAAEAQKVCDTLIEGGVLAIWNFAPVYLNVPENIFVHNENMACSLAVLSKHLNDGNFKNISCGS